MPTIATIVWLYHAAVSKLDAVQPKFTDTDERQYPHLRMSLGYQITARQRFGHCYPHPAYYRHVQAGISVASEYDAAIVYQQTARQAQLEGVPALP
ncbi:hypothetical protein M1N23_00820 [Dehalococcoidia bacterium]|nr:hypothetical protein [Dehalococcoidia bacterium]